ncbi:Hypothetical predicted protein, partial [Paramuricea clavata]
KRKGTKKRLCKDMIVSRLQSKTYSTTLNPLDFVGKIVLRGVTMDGLGDVTGAQLEGCRGAYSRETIPSRKEQIPTPEIASKWEHLRGIPGQLASLDCSMEIGILIGCNCPKALKPCEVIPGREDDPYTVKPRLGWGIIGPANTRYSAEDRKFLEIVKDGICHRDGRYVIPLPMKDNPCNLPNNRIMAMNQLRPLKKRLESNSKYREDYVNFMDKVIKSGYAERLPENERNGTFQSIGHVHSSRKLTGLLCCFLKPDTRISPTHNSLHHVRNCENQTTKSHGGLKGFRAAVVEVDSSQNLYEDNKIPDISLLYNFQYKTSGIRVWKAYELRLRNPEYLMEFTAQGGPVKTSKKRPRFGEKVKGYLIEKFQAGETSGNKADPQTASREMKFKKDGYGKLFFQPDEWKTAHRSRAFSQGTVQSCVNNKSVL